MEKIRKREILSSDEKLMYILYMEKRTHFQEQFVKRKLFCIRMDGKGKEGIIPGDDSMETGRGEMS